MARTTNKKPGDSSDPTADTTHVSLEHNLQPVMPASVASLELLDGSNSSRSFR